MSKHSRPMTPAVIYARVSTWGQARGYGLGRQVKYCNEYADANNYDIAACFCEVGSGGGDQPIRKQAIKVAKAQHAVILCEDLDRWTRSGPDDIDHGVKIVLTAPWVYERQSVLMDIVRMARGLPA